MNTFPEIALDIGQYIDTFVNWLTDNLGFVFDALSEAIIWSFQLSSSILLWLPWWVIIAIVFLLGWRLIRLRTGVIFAVFIFLIGAFGYWELMMDTVSIILASVLISLIIGIPVGILMAYKDRFERLMKPILDAMQTMPTFVYLIPAMMLFGLGVVPGMFATIIYAIPPVIRLTNLAIRNVSKDMVEAADSFGSSTSQVLFKVQLPQALPTIMTGINQTTMMALAMVVVASMVGAQGLGLEVLSALQQIDIATGFEAGISIVFLAIILDRLSQSVAEKYKYTD
ncbi:ABC transporter permease [Salicibibacter kimchii]|uniref:Proline/glycine betaine ABC transporter permease n=1 Tax=Salicibibacter kimchii TaxID=2099786 RepID=A0A345C3Q7_9BACI|nr:proline/glycine betaine ABC transporter permease [Salicibibacter kimchii]AXF57838.1 proline/glycine betaine ABC transporter permease [Salicibibacter kimchii]